MKSIGNIIFGGIGSLVVVSMIAFAMRSLHAFVEFMPPVPWAIGAVFLVAAVVIGFARKRFIGLGMVLVWALGIGFAMVIGQGSDYVTPMREALYAIIPWAFILCCAFACVINAAI